MRIEEMYAVKVVRDRAGVVAGGCGAQAENARDRAEGGKSSKQAAAGEAGHGWA
jgi:hypothetical protein